MPTVFPALKTCELGDASPGDLVKVAAGYGPSLAFVAGENGMPTRHLVMLEIPSGWPETRPPFLIQDVRPQERVLSFGQSYRIDLGTYPSTFHAGWIQEWETPGVIWVNGSDLVLRVGPMPRSGHYRGLWYGLSDGLLVGRGPDRDPSYVSRWELGLDVPAGMPPRSLLSFSVAVSS